MSRTMNTFMFPNNCFYSLIGKREQVKDQFGICMRFPKGNEFKHGNYQIMILEGGSNLTEAKKYLDNIVENTMYFKRRNKEKRKNIKRPLIRIENNEEEPSKRINMFSSLEISESEEEENQLFETKIAPRWGDMV